MSFNAIRWALAQPVAKSSAKFVLVVMADCVPSKGVEWLCWPSYRFLAERTGLDFKTVEAAVHRLRDAHYLIDTGKKKGETGKVVVYRLNTPENGVVISDPEGEGDEQLQHANDPGNGVVKSVGNDPVFPGNPPKFPIQSPQISHAMTPKTGSVTRNEPVITRKKQERAAPMARPSDVTEQTWTDWTALRKAKRSTASETAIEGARKEAALAGMLLEDFLKVWVMRGSQGLEAKWLKPAEKTKPSRHSGFQTTDYTEGMTNGIPDA